MELFERNDMNRLGIAGYGFVGQAHAQIFEEFHQVLINDPDKGHFADLCHADAIIICVATPSDVDGQCDFTNLVDVIDKAPNVPILIKSTISLEGWRFISRSFPDRQLAFSPEFLNRVDDMIMFKSLRREDIHLIIDIELEKLLLRIGNLGYQVSCTDAAKDFIAERGYDEKFGARPLKRAIQKYIEDPLAEHIINSQLQEGDTIILDFETGADELKLTIQKAKANKKKGESKAE